MLGTCGHTVRPVNHPMVRSRSPCCRCCEPGADSGLLGVVGAFWSGYPAPATPSGVQNHGEDTDRSDIRTISETWLQLEASVVKVEPVVGADNGRIDLVWCLG
jgi:hypothetical protein